MTCVWGECVFVCKCVWMANTQKKNVSTIKLLEMSQHTTDSSLVAMYCMPNNNTNGKQQINNVDRITGRCKDFFRKSDCITINTVQYLMSPINKDTAIRCVRVNYCSDDNNRLFEIDLWELWHSLGE